jgi:hypothetical protein
MCIYIYEHTYLSSESVRPRACFIGLLHHGHGIFNTAHVSRHLGAAIGLCPPMSATWLNLMFYDLSVIVWRFGICLDMCNYNVYAYMYV